MARMLDLTGQNCHMLESIRLALEVLLGTRIRFRTMHLDLKAGTGRGYVSVRGEDREITFTENTYSTWSIEIGGTWYDARLDNVDRVRVIASDRPSDNSEALWMVGTSYIDRWTEPFFVKVAP